MYRRNSQDLGLLDSSIKMMDNSWDLFPKISICIIKLCDSDGLWNKYKQYWIWFHDHKERICSLSEISLRQDHNYSNGIIIMPKGILFLSLYNYNLKTCLKILEQVLIDPTSWNIIQDP